MGFTDGKDVSRTIRTGFTDTLVVSHSTRELTERRFVMDKTLYKDHWAWVLLIYTFANSIANINFRKLLKLILYMFEDIFCWYTYYPKIFQTLFFFLNREFGDYICKIPPTKRIKRRDTQKGKGKKADKRGKKTAVVFSDENEQKLVDFLCDNEILYNKHLKNYKDRSKRKAVWDKFCDEYKLDKDACQKWSQSQRTLFRKVTHMKSVLGGPQLTERQKWTRDNFHFLRGHIVRHFKGKSEFGASKGSASQASAAAGSASRRETVHMVPFQDTSHLESTYDPADMSHLDTNTPTPRSRGISVPSSFTDSDFQSALVESRRGITELKDIVAKKLTDDKADNPRLDYYYFLKVEVVHLTSGSYDEFQQEWFKLLRRLKWRDKQQRYHHGMGTSTAASGSSLSSL